MGMGMGKDMGWKDGRPLNDSRRDAVRRRTQDLAQALSFSLSRSRLWLSSGCLSPVLDLCLVPRPWLGVERALCLASDALASSLGTRIASSCSAGLVLDNSRGSAQRKLGLKRIGVRLGCAGMRWAELG